MPHTAALIASLILGRPMCIPCIAEKAGTTETSVRALFTHVVVPIVWYGERCRACGRTGIVVSLIDDRAA